MDNAICYQTLLATNGLSAGGLVNFDDCANFSEKDG